MKGRAFLFLLAVALPSTAAGADERCSSHLDVAGLPIVEVPSEGSGDTFAVMIAGDGGWRRIDKKITERLIEKDIPVAGFLTPSYFKVMRTPEESACALERTILTYSARWKRDRVILIGYSRGADVLPFMVSSLPADVKAMIRVIALLGLEQTIDFRYHPSWIPFYHPHEPQFSVEIEMEKLRGSNILCFYGKKEKDSLCRTLDPLLAKPVQEEGGHHFGGNYVGIADRILEAAK
ncbi:MAG: AcvB/VirJ family lysyl-phosphatidylglycerol hydrolase [Acidobacteriota bacterium]